MRYLVIIICLVIGFPAVAQNGSPAEDPGRKIRMGVDAGIGASYTDRAFQVNIPVSFRIDLALCRNFFLQFAPKYTFLTRWNEHYLTLPLHLRKQFGEKISVFAGPAITLDVGHFNDFGASGGICYHLSNRSSIILSAFTFTLYDYDIDYFFVPVALSWQYNFMR